MHSVSIIITISAILLLSPYFSKISRIPTTPIEIILGSFCMLVGFLSDNHIFTLMAEVGFFYLMFLAGLEVDLKELLKMSKTTIYKGLFYVILLYILSALSIYYFDFSKTFIIILPLISIGLIPTLMKEFGKDQEWLSYALTIGIIGEIVSIIVLTVASAIFQFGVGKELYTSLAYLVIFLAIAAAFFKLVRIIFWWFPELKEFLMPQFDKNEEDVRLSMAIFFLMISAMIVLNLEIAFGAFIAGTFIATFFEHKEGLPLKLESFGFGFLIPIFFIHVGASFDLKFLLFDGLVIQAFYITLIMIAIRFISIYLVKPDLSNLKNKFLFALSHAMPLTLIIAIATIAHKTDSITQFNYYVLILASLFEVIVSMGLIKIMKKIFV